MADPGASPSIGLVYVLFKVFSAIILGYVCRSSGMIVPEAGDTKALNFFVGRVAFPLLIFNTIATAELGSIDFGVILACSCAKLVVFWSAWLLGFLVYQKSQRRYQRGQRILTATVFGFLTIASDDFATGFPVIKALYGDDMTVYIAANSLVGSFVMVPMTLVLLEVGKTVQIFERSQAVVGREAAACRLGPLCQNVLRNPVIVMTVLGLLFQLLLGRWCLVEKTDAMGLRIREPFNGVIQYWTEPFGMLALFSTGLSLRSASIHFWPMILVSFKLLVCAYLSYAFGMLFVTRRPPGRCLDFTFFYGSIPASSAPLVFASQFDESVVELVAAAILVGYVMAGPNMFIDALFLSHESADMTATLNSVQGATGIASSVGAALVLAFLALSYSSWGWSCALLGVYAGVVLFYGIIGSHLAATCTTPTPSRFEMFLFNWLQKACFLLVLYMQALQSQSLKWQQPRLRKRWLVLVLLAGATLLASVMPAAALDQLCGLAPAPVASVVSSLIMLASVLGLVLWDLVRSRRNEPQESAAPSDIQKHPVGVAKTMCVVQGLRLLMQVVNAAAFHEDAGDGIVRGGFVQMMILEHVLEVGQGIFCAMAVLLQELNQDRVAAACGSILCMTSSCVTGSFQQREALATQVQALPFLEGRPDDRGCGGHSSRAPRVERGLTPMLAESVAGQ